MSRLIIGSTAMREYIPSCRYPKDVDMFSDSSGYDTLDGRAETFWHPDFAQWLPPGTYRIATLNELYTIKVSHSYWNLKNGSWDKHMFDIVQLKKVGAVVIQDLHDMLYRVCEELHGSKSVNLSDEAEKFFSASVSRKYVHDSIHETVAYGGRPLYESVRKGGASVSMDMRKMWSLPFEDQVRMFREEIFVIALERWLIPHDFKFSPRRAYAQALKLAITSLTKGRSAQFLVENYDTFRNPDVDYVARHKSNSHKLVMMEA